MFIIQMAGENGWTQEAYKCTEMLIGNNDVSGNVPRTGEEWTWACRSSGNGYGYPNGERWTNVINGRRAWFMYQGPVREYYGSWGWGSGPSDPYGNAYDCWGGAWYWNSSLDNREPISNKENPGQNWTVNYRKAKMRVISYCPSMIKTDGASVWWHERRAPHMNRPTPGDVVTLSPPVDARNYLFTDGHAIFLKR